VAYASKHGATTGIAEHIAQTLRTHGREAGVVPVDAVERLGAYDAVVLGSAMYYGSWMKEAVEFAERHAETLVERPVWLFSSGPLGEHVEDEEEQPKQLADLRGLIGPIDHRVFFGALDRSKLGFGERMMVKAVKAPEGDFRDWDAIRGWADGIADHLQGSA
ncbi:MAG TPA: flavodoxin domain-containing protein, partial [Actinomycetota bacterium]|nr:flavodoxin domain-containing protein [Actinomycetota bacterium]